MLRQRLFALLLIPVASAPAAAHGGALNAEGCHNNRKTGDYDCHRGPAATPAPSLQRLVPAPAGIAGGSYPNCAAARAAGAAPLRRGEAGYSAKLDRDADGVACE